MSNFTLSRFYIIIIIIWINVQICQLRVILRFYIAILIAWINSQILHFRDSMIFVICYYVCCILYIVIIVHIWLCAQIVFTLSCSYFIHLVSFIILILYHVWIYIAIIIRTQMCIQFMTKNLHESLLYIYIRHIIWYAIRVSFYVCYLMCISRFYYIYYVILYIMCSRQLFWCVSNLIFDVSQFRCYLIRIPTQIFILLSHIAYIYYIILYIMSLFVVNSCRIFHVFI